MEDSTLYKQWVHDGHTKIVSTNSVEEFTGKI
jgi:hypothetical protein